MIFDQINLVQINLSKATAIWNSSQLNKRFGSPNYPENNQLSSSSTEYHYSSPSDAE